MTTISKIKAHLKRYIKNTQGNFAIMAGVMMMVLMAGVGSAYDYSQAAKARSLAQLASDNMALAAAIAASQDNMDRYIEGQAYTYANIGGPGKDFTRSITGSVKYDLVDTNGETVVRATVSGVYKPIFGSIIGVTSVPFTAFSDVTKAASAIVPASIFFVTDNSGSMGGRDRNGQAKISGLRNSMNDFMTNIADIPQGDDPLIRTALFPYNHSLISGRVVRPKWGTLSTGEISSMSAGGGTRSTQALSVASGLFRNEQAIHKNINGEDNALKFLVFMSDGANNSTSTDRSSVSICSQMKRDPDLKIYSIAYGVGGRAAAFMRDCSSGPDYYQYAASGTDLQNVFDEIGEEIINEVIRIKR